MLVDDRNEKIGRKIRDNELKRIPFLLIVGGKGGTGRHGGCPAPRAEGDKGVMTKDDFVGLTARWSPTRFRS